MWYVSIMRCLHLLKQHSQAEVGGIQGAVESVCCLGCMREVSPMRLYEVGDIIRKLIGGAFTC